MIKNSKIRRYVSEEFLEWLKKEERCDANRKRGQNTQLPRQERNPGPSEKKVYIEDLGTGVPPKARASHAKRGKKVDCFSNQSGATTCWGPGH